MCYFHRLWTIPVQSKSPLPLRVMDFLKNYMVNMYFDIYLLFIPSALYYQPESKKDGTYVEQRTIFSDWQKQGFAEMFKHGKEYWGVYFLSFIIYVINPTCNSVNTGRKAYCLQNGRFEHRRPVVDHTNTALRYRNAAVYRCCLVPNS